jgi:hypothetical protein
MNAILEQPPTVTAEMLAVLQAVLRWERNRRDFRTNRADYDKCRAFEDIEKSIHRLPMSQQREIMGKKWRG